MTTLDLTLVNRRIPIGVRRAWLSERRILHSSVLSGDYLLKDNSFSASTVWGQEKGIFLNPEKYLDLENLPLYEITLSEAFSYCKSIGASLPTQDELQLLEMSRGIINNSLQAIGLANAYLPENVAQNFWSQEDIIKGNNGYRRMLIIRSAENAKRDVLNINSSLDKSPFAVPEIEVATGNFGDPYWLLQRIDGWFYVLDARCKCYMYTPQDATCNGRYYIEWDQLVVENPTETTFFDGPERYVKTIKDYFKKDNYGLYRKVGTGEGARKAPHCDTDY